MKKNYDRQCFLCGERKAIYKFQSLYQPSRKQIRVETARPHICDFCLTDKKRFNFGHKQIEIFDDYDKLKNRIVQLADLYEQKKIGFHDITLVWLNRRAVENANKYYEIHGMEKVKI